MIYDKISFHYPSDKCRSIFTAKEHIKKFLTCMDNHNLLTEYGNSVLNNLGENTIITTDMLTDEGNEVVKLYYNRWNKNITYSEIQDEINDFWKERIIDWRVINSKSKPQDRSTTSYFQSVIYNIPLNAKSVEIEGSFNDNYMAIRFISFDKDGTRIKSDRLQSISYYDTYYYIGITREEDLIECTKRVNKGLSEIKEKWNIDIPTKITFNEMRIVI